MRFGKSEAAGKKGKRIIEALVRERRGGHEKKLEVARLRENLVHEEFQVNVHDVYNFSEGKDAKEVGGFGEVQVVRHRQSGAKFALKTVAISKLKSKTAFDYAMREVDLLKSLDHPNIVRLQEVYVTPTHLYVAMDLIEGGNLAVRYVFEGEEKAAHILRQIVRALRYLHDRNIAHRDLKLENILLDHKGGDAAVKLVDFGLSALYEENAMSTDVLGSWNYVAPEVIQGKYQPAPADMWSLGVVSFILMGDKPPFDDVDTDRIKRRILAARYGFSSKVWVRASEASKHFIRSLLQKRPSLRPTAAQAQVHDWLKVAEQKSQAPRTADPAFVDNVARSMLDFREANPMKQLALEVVARTLDLQQIRLLTEEFDRADKTNDGEVSLAEFQRWMASNPTTQSMSEEDVTALFEAVDVDNSGLIHFNEFLAASISQRSLDEFKLKTAFDRLDRSHTGFIELRDVLLTTGKAANEEQSTALLRYFDDNGDGRISFDEFVKGMRRMDPSTEGSRRVLISPSASSASCPSHGANSSNAVAKEVVGGRPVRHNAGDGDEEADAAAAAAPASCQENSQEKSLDLSRHGNDNFEERISEHFSSPAASPYSTGAGGVVQRQQQVGSDAAASIAASSTMAVDVVDPSSTRGTEENYSKWIRKDVAVGAAAAGSVTAMANPVAPTNETALFQGTGKGVVNTVDCVVGRGREGGEGAVTSGEVRLQILGNGSDGVEAEHERRAVGIGGSQDAQEDYYRATESRMVEGDKITSSSRKACCIVA